MDYSLMKDNERNIYKNYWTWPKQKLEDDL